MKILAIDGNSIMNRAFYGIRMLSNDKGMFTNAITGFMNIYKKVFSEISPDGVVCAFDLKAPTFRHKKVSSYKANRKGMPEELAVQMPYIKEILKAMGVKVLEIEGFEADDILGTVSKICDISCDSCFILTGDRDSLQLVSDNTTVLLHTTKELIHYTPERFFSEYGFESIHIIDLKALMGDSSDNISGVKGIGEKTAKALISENKTVENVYKTLEENTLNATKSVLTKLEAGKDDAYMSKWLATIVRDVPIINSVDEMLCSERDEEKLSEILTELQMYKLLMSLNLPIAKKSESSTENSPEKKVEIPEKGDFEADKENIAKSVSSFIFDGKSVEIFSCGKIYTLTDKENILKYFEGDSKKIAFSAKEVYKYCMKSDKELKNLVFDTEIAAYLLDSEEHNFAIDNLFTKYNICECEYVSQRNYRLYNILSEKIKNDGMEFLLDEIELPLTEVLASMEYYGVRVDTDGIREFGNTLCDDMEGIKSQIYFIAGHEFNISSPKQLGTVLFEEMKLPKGKKTKTGYSTNADVLEELRSYPIVDLVLVYRQLSKLNSTYVEGLLKAVSPDGKVHSVFKQTETRTGRISSAEPNVQNIPVRTARGKEMRKFFISDDGYTLLDADYSQIELRILAHMSDDKNMIEAFKSGQDIHAVTASQVFDMPLNMVTPEMRRSAKAVNFGIVYGIGAFSLSKDIDVSVKKAEEYIKNYLKKYNGVDRFMKSSVENAQKTGYALTMYGRRRIIPELKSPNKNMQAFGKRAAMNAPIQGTAADIIKIAMVKVYKRLKAEKLNARLILQVHDELIIEAQENDKQKAEKILSEEMKSAAPLSVELTAEVSSGKSWFEAKK